jgi:poly(glycerol-phosphate) alpha-glucosyltransferase
VAVPHIALPPGRQYAVLWGIPDDFAGMTNSVMHRSRALVREAGAEVTILTFEHRDDYDVVRARLRERGAMIDGMSLRNMWEDLRTWDDAQLKSLPPGSAKKAAAAFDPLGDRGEQEGPLIRRLRDDEGKVLQTDYFREDGTLLVSDRRTGRRKPRRSVTICDTSGQPLATWRRARKLYFAWLDSLPREPVAWLICDSKTPAPHITHYRRPDVFTIHVVRGSHLRAGTGRPDGVLYPGREHVMKNLDLWDAVVFLTHEQLKDVETLLGHHDNLHVIPNNRPVPAKVPNVHRTSRRGVMLASLIERKQVGHAIRAVKLAGRIRGRRPELDIFGDGEKEKRMRTLIRLLRAPARLRGYSPTAVDHFENASFSLLTSASEAFANVLIESMGRGCIPISYETPYGPTDIITHGVDGFLVPYNDFEAMARQIREVVAMKPKQLEPLRVAAHQRALEFTDFTDRWAGLMHDLAAGRAQS